MWSLHHPSFLAVYLPVVHWISVEDGNRFTIDKATVGGIHAHCVRAEDSHIATCASPQDRQDLMRKERTTIEGVRKAASRLCPMHCPQVRGSKTPHGVVAPDVNIP